MPYNLKIFQAAAATITYKVRVHGATVKVSVPVPGFNDVKFNALPQTQSYVAPSLKIHGEDQPGPVITAAQIKGTQDFMKPQQVHGPLVGMDVIFAFRDYLGIRCKAADPKVGYMAIGVVEFRWYASAVIDPETGNGSVTGYMEIVEPSRPLAAGEQTEVPAAPVP